MYIEGPCNPVREIVSCAQAGHGLKFYRVVLVEWFHHQSLLYMKELTDRGSGIPNSSGTSTLSVGVESGV